MPSGPSDAVVLGSRYGAAGFAAAVVNVLALEYLTWFFSTKDAARRYGCQPHRPPRQVKEFTT